MRLRRGILDARAGRAKRGIVIEAWPDLPAKNITSHNFACWPVAGPALAAHNVESLILENTLLDGHDLSGAHTRLDPDYTPSHHGNAAVQVADKDYH